MAVKVAIAFSNLLFAQGISKLLEGTKDIEVTELFKVGSLCDEKVAILQPDVVLVDLLTLYNGFQKTGTEGDIKLILFDTTCGEENLASAILQKDVRAVVPVNATLTTLKKAIRAVAKRGLWLEKEAT